MGIMELKESDRNKLLSEFEKYLDKIEEADKELKDKVLHKDGPSSRLSPNLEKTLKE